MQPNFFLTRTHVSAAALTCLLLSACTSVSQDIRDIKTKASDRIVQEQKSLPQRPVVTRSASAWIMGEAIEVKAPAPKFLTRKITYSPGHAVTLTDVAEKLADENISVDTSEVWSNDTTGVAATISAPITPAPMVPSLSGAGHVAPGSFTGSNNANAAKLPFTVSYEGNVKGLLDLVAGKVGVWWKTTPDGRVVFYRSETKTFYLASLPNRAKGSSQISTNASSGGASTGSSSGTSGSAGGNGGGSGTVNASGNLGTGTEFDVDVWKDLEKTVKTVAGTAETAVNPSAGSVTVTGTPTQVRNVEEWVNSLNDNFSQQVAITLDIFSVRLKAEDAYNWSPNVVFNSLSDKYGINLSGPTIPLPSSGASPLNLSASILSSATGKVGQYSGSQFALGALSTLGDVASVMHQTVVTLNGRPAPIQMADIEGYLASLTPSASVAIGATPMPPSLTPSSITTGFTATFIPKVVGGKIFLSIDMTNSTNNGFGKQGTDTNFIQTPNYSQNTALQSFKLTPGDSLLLTSTQQMTGKSNRSGVGSPHNFALGGGFADSAQKVLTAIVVTAKVL